VILFKCDLNPAVSIVTVHGHPFQCAFHMKDVMISQLIFLLCVCVRTCSCVHAWTNPRLQETKPFLFSTTCEGLQNHKLCQNYFAGQVVNW